MAGTHVTDKLLGGWVDAVQQFAPRSVHELAVDEELVRELQVHLVSGDLDGVVGEHWLGIPATHLNHHGLGKRNSPYLLRYTYACTYIHTYSYIHTSTSCILYIYINIYSF